MDAGRRAPTPTRLRKSENQVDARVYLCGGEEAADEATAMRVVRTCVPRLQRRTGGDSAGGIAAAEVGGGGGGGEEGLARERERESEEEV